MGTNVLFLPEILEDQYSMTTDAATMIAILNSNGSPEIEVV